MRRVSAGAVAGVWYLFLSLLAVLPSAAGASGDLEQDGTAGSAGVARNTPVVPVCRGRPGGTCSATKAQACAYDADCPRSETCAWTQPFPRFVDNGNGTVSDNRTCLTWEKKTRTLGGISFCPGGPTCSDPHNVNNRYTWSAATPPGSFDGSVATDFLKKLNDAAFAGYTDWRLPTSAGTADSPSGNDPELESLFSRESCYSSGAPPCIDPIFEPTAAGHSPGLGSDSYWTSSSAPPSSTEPSVDYAWTVSFYESLGIPHPRFKSSQFGNYARAVRGGP